MAREPGTHSLILYSLLLAAGCAHRPSLPDPDALLLDGLLQVGGVQEVRGSGDRLVVIIRDRHAIHGAITSASPTLRAVQRDNSRAMRFLLQKGFRFLGCEAAMGPLPENEAAAAHRLAARRALQQEGDLDRLTIYQPLRYEVEHEGNLLVLGVEDPKLYEEDARTLEVLVEIDSLLRRADTDPKEIPALKRRRLELLRQIRQHSRERGRRAAENLLELMEQQQQTLAVLLIGGAHVPAASERLSQDRVSHLIFESRSYRL